MIKALRNPTRRDKRALAVFFGVALLCAIYFASGILVSYVSPPADYIEMSKDGRGTLVEIANIPTFETALQLSNALLEQRRLQAVIEISPTGFGYLLRIGPVVRRSMAERLANELQSTGYERITIRESCPDGGDCPPVSAASAASAPSAPSGAADPVSSGSDRQPNVAPTTGPIGPTGRTGESRP